MNIPPRGFNLIDKHIMDETGGFVALAKASLYMCLVCLGCPAHSALENPQLFEKPGRKVFCLVCRVFRFALFFSYISMC
jgi:hypothetical protein